LFAGCAGLADVAFVIDSSGSIGDTNFDAMKVAVTQIINDLDMDTGRVKVGVITFSDNSKMEFELNRYTNR